MKIERLLETLRFPHIGMQLRAMFERVDSARFSLWILEDDQLHSGFLRDAVTKLVHRAELPRCVDMQQREGRHAGSKCFASQMYHHRRILSHRVQHYRVFHFRDYFAHDMDRFSFQALQMRELYL